MNKVFRLNFVCDNFVGNPADQDLQMMAGHCSRIKVGGQSHEKEVKVRRVPNSLREIDTGIHRRTPGEIKNPGETENLTNVAAEETEIGREIESLTDMTAEGIEIIGKTVQRERAGLDKIVKKEKVGQVETVETEKRSQHEMLGRGKVDQVENLKKQKLG